MNIDTLTQAMTGAYTFLLSPPGMVLMALAGGLFGTQLVKLPLRKLIKEDWQFDTAVRVLSAAISLAILWRADMPAELKVVFSLSGLAVYHATLPVIRRWFPGLEASPLIGSVSVTKPSGDEDSGV
jgi:hypothetical protein